MCNQSNDSFGNVVAGPGRVFVCHACGKRSYDRYGDQKVDSGWDASCVIHAVECLESSLEFSEHGRVTKAEAWRKE
jgi:hypothetical protein